MVHLFCAILITLFICQTVQGDFAGGSGKKPVFKGQLNHSTLDQSQAKNRDVNPESKSQTKTYQQLLDSITNTAFAENERLMACKALRNGGYTGHVGMVALKEQLVPVLLDHSKPSLQLCVLDYLYYRRLFSGVFSYADESLSNVLFDIASNQKSEAAVIEKVLRIMERLNILSESDLAKRRTDVLSGLLSHPHPVVRRATANTINLIVAGHYVFMDTHLAGNLWQRLLEGKWDPDKVNGDPLTKPISTPLSNSSEKAAQISNKLLPMFLTNGPDSPEGLLALRMLKRFARDNDDVMGKVKVQLVERLNRTADVRNGAALDLQEIGDNSSWIINALIREREWTEGELDYTFYVLRSLHDKKFANYTVIQFLLNKVQSKTFSPFIRQSAATVLGYVSPNYPHVRKAIADLKSLNNLSNWEKEQHDKAIERALEVLSRHSSQK